MLRTSVKYDYSLNLVIFAERHAGGEIASYGGAGHVARSST